MTIGLEQFREERRADRLGWMLLLPFFCRTGAYPLNRRGQDAPGEEQAHARTRSPPGLE